MARKKASIPKKVRTVRNPTDGKTYFAIADIVQILADTLDPSDTIKKMRKRSPEMSSAWKKQVKRIPVPTVSGTQNISCGPVGGLIWIVPVVSSPAGRKFRNWMINEVAINLKKKEKRRPAGADSTLITKPYSAPKSLSEIQSGISRDLGGLNVGTLKSLLKFLMAAGRRAVPELDRRAVPIKKLVRKPGNRKTKVLMKRRKKK